MVNQAKMEQQDHLEKRAKMGQQARTVNLGHLGKMVNQAKMEHLARTVQLGRLARTGHRESLARMVNLARTEPKVNLEPLGKQDRKGHLGHPVRSKKANTEKQGSLESLGKMEA